jgi:DNA polymerase-1
MKKILLIDVSNLFFRAFYAVPGHFTAKDGTPSNAIYGVISVIFSLMESQKPTHIFAAQDLKGGTFRHEEIEGYKAGRPEMPENLVVQLPKIFEFFSEAMNIPLLSKESFEADDILATIAEHFRGSDSEVHILSADQDLLQIVGENVFVMYPQNGAGKPPKVMDCEAVHEKLGVYPNRVADYKAIAGDSSDRLAGVPGIGPVGAKKILTEFDTVENAIENVEKISGKLGELMKEFADQALLTKRMATLHRDLEIDGFSEKAGEVALELTPELLEFLEHISSRNLITRAKKIFGELPPPAEQMGMF